jgi:hypothetical protein
MSKAETIRRLLIGDLRRIFRHRYGATLPDDDAGRDDLMLLLLPISLCRNETVEKMQRQIEVIAPWMPDTQAEQLIDQIMLLPPWHRRPSGKEIGERIQLTNAEREMLKTWRIAPVDLTPAELSEQRKAKDRARRRLKRAEAGAVSRQAYLANAKSKLQPWKASGVNRSTWYRRLRQVRPRQDLTTSGTTCLTVPRASRGEPVSASETTRRLMGQRKGPKDHRPQVPRTDLSQREGESLYGALPCTVRRT